MVPRGCRGGDRTGTVQAISVDTLMGGREGDPQHKVVGKCFGKTTKRKSLFQGRFQSLGCSAHAETIGNVCSFAHADYDANPYPERLFHDQIACFRSTILLVLSALRAPTVGPLYL